MKILYVATVVKKHIMRFHVHYLKMLKEMGWETSVAARNDYENESDCIIPYCDNYFNLQFERNPLNPKNIKVYWELKRIIEEGNYDIIHCHTPVGALLTRLAAADARKKGTKVFYTAHGFHFYKGAPLVNWLFYYPVEIFLARKTDVLLTINKEDYDMARKFKAGKAVYTPGVGIDPVKYNPFLCSSEEKRTQLGVKKNDFVILSFGELIPRENHKVLLDALGRLKQSDLLSDIHLILCGSGPLLNDLKRQADELEIQDNVHFLGDRNDICEIMYSSDLFISLSTQEGIPLALMESMSCGLPAICANTPGNISIVENSINGEIVENNAIDIEKAIIKLKNEASLRRQYSCKAQKTIRHYDFSNIKESLLSEYARKGINPTSSNLLLDIRASDLKKRFNIPLSATVLLSVGEVNKNKNHQVVVDVLPNYPDCYFIICGQGSKMDDLKNKSRQLGISERVIFAGFQSDVSIFYRISDIFIFPSIREGLGMVVLEAMCNNVLCVVASNRGTFDLLPDSRLRFEPCNSDDLNKKLMIALNEDCTDEIEKYKDVLEKFNTKNSLGLMKELYENSCN